MLQDVVLIFACIMLAWALSTQAKVEPVVLQLYAVGFPCDDKSASTHISAFIPHDTEVRTDDMIWFQCKQSIKAFTIERFEE